jgi:hypothetical protein
VPASAAPSEAVVKDASLTSSLLSASPNMTDLFRHAERLRCVPGLFARDLAGIRAQPERMAELARLAYWHQNGFAKIKVAETGSYSVRLHIWPPGDTPRGDVDPHSHRWEFASLVVAGAGIRERRFALADEPAGSRYIACEYGRRDGVRYLEQTGEAWLREVSGYRRPYGHVYSCPRNVLHTVEPIGADLVATIVVQGPVDPSPALVFRSPDRGTAMSQGSISTSELDQLFADAEKTSTNQ